MMPASHSYPITFSLTPSARVPDGFRLPSNPALEQAVAQKWNNRWEQRTRALAKSVARAVIISS